MGAWVGTREQEKARQVAMIPGVIVYMSQPIKCIDGRDVAGKLFNAPAAYTDCRSSPRMTGRHRRNVRLRLCGIIIIRRMSSVYAAAFSR
jgi:hypothetical protein